MSKVVKPSKETVELISSKFATPDEFVTMYNAYIMGRLKGKDQELDEWFNRIDEDILDKANEYYLHNERIKKFTHDLHAIRRKCRTKAQREYFNQLLKEFGIGNHRDTKEVECDNPVKSVKSYCTTKDQRRAFNALLTTLRTNK